jgi:hypothetical protein
LPGIYKRRSEKILKKFQLGRYDVPAVKRIAIQNVILVAIFLVGCFVLATRDQLLLQPLFWLWIAGLFILSCLATLTFIILSGTGFLIVLAMMVYLVLAVLFIQVFPHKEMIPDPSTILMFFLTFVVAGMTLISVLDYLIIRKLTELSTSPKLD